MTIPTWAAWTAGLTAVCTTLLALSAVIRTVVRPLVMHIAALNETLPVMIEIARQYADERGGEVLTAELAALATGQGTIAEMQRETVQRLEQVNSSLHELHDYAHSMKHDIIGDVSALNVVFGTTTTVIDALGRTADELTQVRRALARMTAQEE